MTPPTNRLGQTLNTLRYLLSVKQPPLVKWRNLLAIIQHEKEKGKPMTAAELEFATGSRDQGAYLRIMETEGLISFETGAHGTKLFRATPKGQEVAQKLIEGLAPDPGVAPPVQPDMGKVMTYFREREK